MLSRRQVISSLAALPVLTHVRHGFTQQQGATVQDSFRWVVFYAADADIEAFDPYQLVVFDRAHHPWIEPLTDAGKPVFGYLSVGEISQDRPEFEKIKSWGILRGENPYWPGSHFVDVRDPRWGKHLIEKIIPGVLHRGFTGLFLDTLDNPPELERRDPAGNLGMTRAAARLVQAFKLHWPSVPLILNRGYELLPRVAGTVDYVLGESIYTDYDFENKVYGRVETELYEEQVAILKRARKLNPDLTILSLDYWDPADSETIRDIYRVQRQNGFHPYVATVELDRIVPEPSS